MELTKFEDILGPATITPLNQLSGLSEKEISICRLLVQVNELTSYPLGADQISDWAKSINKLLPELALEKLELVIDKMKMGEIDFDRNLGIQNIFLGLKSLTRPMVY